MDDVTREAPVSDRLRALLVVRRRLAVVLVCLVVVPAAAVAFSLRQETQYKASATMQFKDNQFDQQLFGTSLQPRTTDPTRAAATNSKLVSLNVTAQAAAERLPGATAQSILNKVSVSEEGQSDLVSIVATDHDPDLAARIANTFARSFIELRQRRDRATILEAQRLILNQINSLASQSAPKSRLSQLRSSAEQLGVLAALQTGNSQLVQPAVVPTHSSSPRPVRNGILGLLLGGLFGIGLAFALDRIDTKLREPEEAEEALGRPVLGHIPASRTLSPQSRPSDAETEAFLLLRASLRYFNIDRDLRSILITSAAPGEGKTTIAWNLALAASNSEPNVLLIEADLRRPGVGLNVLPRGRELGLSNVLSGATTFDEAVQTIQTGVEGNGAGPSKTVNVLASGPLPPNPLELMESERMGELIEQVERRHSLVILDTPPVSTVSDAIPLLGRVGGTIVVTRLKRSSRHSLVRLSAQLAQLGITPLGVVVNAMAPRDAYGYGYGSKYTKASSTSPVAEPVGTADNGVASLSATAELGERRAALAAVPLGPGSSTTAVTLEEDPGGFEPQRASTPTPTRRAADPPAEPPPAGFATGSSDSLLAGVQSLARRVRRRWRHRG